MAGLGEERLFSGLVFWGGEFLPGNIVPSMNDIRKWAIKQGLVSDAEAEFVAAERIAELRKHFTRDDEIMVLVHIEPDPSGRLGYSEYPFLPVKTLIKHGANVQVVYWRLRPSAWAANGDVTGYGEVRFGFWYPDVSDEFCSTSTAKLVVPKFRELLEALSSAYSVREFDDGAREIEVDGDVEARFYKAGRLFDVELKTTPKES